MSEEQKNVKQLKGGKKLKTQAAVVPKQRKLRKRKDKLPAELMGTQRIRKRNIFFTVIFSILLIATLVNFYFYDFLIIALPDFVFSIIVPVIIVLEIFFVLLSFETYKVEFKITPLRILLTILIPIISLPFTLFKWHTRHNVWRVVFTGLTIGLLLISFFGPYAAMLNKYRDLPPGEIEEQLVDAGWFDSLFQGSAPFYIDGLLDLLDALDLNDTIGDQIFANITAESGSLDNFLYRWQINEYYDSSTWEFTSNDVVRYDLEPGHYGPPGAATVTDMNITQLSYSVTTSILDPLLTTWSSYYKPHLYEVSDWDEYLKDENQTVAAVDGSTNIKYNTRDQLSLQTTAELLGFMGSYNYRTYFALDDDPQTLIDNCQIDYTPGYMTNARVAPFLQVPASYDEDYEVVIFANQIRDFCDANSYTIYERVTYILDQILLQFGAPTPDDTDNNGQDRALLLLRGEDHSLSAYLALTIMTLRLNDIPARPVFGFAIGEGNTNARRLTFDYLYGWIEALLPIDEGGADPVHRWGQFQIGPYPYQSDYVYGENTLYTSFDVDVEMFEFPTYAPVSTGSYDGKEAYIIDNTQYVVRATISAEGTPEEGVLVNFRAISSLGYELYGDDPTTLLANSDNLGSATTNILGYADIFPEFNETYYPVFDPGNETGTTFIIYAYVSFTSLNATAFVVLPEGYLSAVTLDADQDTVTYEAIPYNAYIVQIGFIYTITSTLYEEPAHLTPVSDRTVSYYIMSDDDYDLLLDNLTNYDELELIGRGVTNLGGVSSVLSNDTEVDHFAQTPNQIYYVVASFGQNYTATPIYVVDYISSTISLNDTVLDVAIDGYILWEQVDFFLYFQVTNPVPGVPIPIDGESLEYWVIPAAGFEAWTGAKTIATYQQELFDTYNATVPRNAIHVKDGITDGSGQNSKIITIDARDYGAGSFVILVFYMDLGRWNGSETITITTPPGRFITQIEDTTESCIEETAIIITRPELSVFQVLEQVEMQILRIYFVPLILLQKTCSVELDCKEDYI